MKNLIISMGILVLFSCASTTLTPPRTIQGKETFSQVEFPQIKKSDKLEAFILTQFKKQTDLSDSDRKLISKRIAAYLGFLGLDPSIKGTDAAALEAQDVLKRLLNSSTQFLICDNLNDWECLEKKPTLKPANAFRQETDDSLGSPVQVAKNLEPNLKFYFTNQFDVPKDKRDSNLFLVNKLANILKSENWDEISMALYGVDEIKNSMKPFYEAVLGRIESGTKVRGVFDSGGVVTKTPVIFTHRGDVTNDQNIFKRDREGKMPLQFQYEDTPSLIEVMNKNCKNEGETRARLEWPPSPTIMHNKFIVFKNEKQMSVWTGTANISQTCMGEESNSNMGIYILNEEVANVFLTEFEEMFQFQKTPMKNAKYKAMQNEQIWGGRFHQDKTPNTKRYFKFKDGYELKVHFSPTDDGEHRVIIPMLHAAKAGDVVRISMFGHGGIEIVRALQWAAARGVNIRIFLDTATMFNPKSWVANNSFVKIQDKNPYSDSPTPIQYLRNSWGNQNHHKTATLTRNENGKDQVKYLIVGSQNWSKTGNDENDENMISIRNLEGSVKAGEAFNEHFDTRLWPNGK